MGVEQEAQMGPRDSERKEKKRKKVRAVKGTIGGRAVEGMGCH